MFVNTKEHGVKSSTEELVHQQQDFTDTVPDGDPHLNNTGNGILTYALNGSGLYRIFCTKMSYPRIFQSCIKHCFSFYCDPP